MGRFYGASQAGADTAAHAGFHRNLAVNAVIKANVGYGFKHRRGAAGKHAVGVVMGFAPASYTPLTPPRIYSFLTSFAFSCL